MKRTTYPDLVLAISLTSRGMGYVVLEGPQTPFDWGMMGRDAKNQSRVAIAKVATLIETCQPVAMVLENLDGKAVRHSRSLKRLSLRLAHLAENRGLTVARFDRTTIRNAFAPLGAKTKPEIAEAIAIAIPAFSHRTPPKRKIWMSEDRRQLLFDAAALGMTYLGRDHADV